MIDLAPGHKQGLAVANPILLGAGSVGLGDAAHPELDLRALGAVVVGPVSARSWGGRGGVRYAPLPAGALIEAGGQNRGLDASLRYAAPLWARLGVPVIVQVVAAHEPLERLVEPLGGVEGVTGLELLLPPRADMRDVARLCETVTRAVDLPLWVKLPYTGHESIVALARAAVETGCSALVVAQPQRGMAAVDGAGLLEGSLYGPSLFAGVLRLLRALVKAEYRLPLLASGGIFTLEQVRAALATGAAAVQLDAVVWTEPTLPGVWARALTQA